MSLITIHMSDSRYMAKETVPLRKWECMNCTILKYFLKNSEVDTLLIERILAW